MRYALLIALALLPCGVFAACGSDKPAVPPEGSTQAGAITAFLSRWAEAVGSETDATTGYPKRIRRTKDGGEMVLIPAGTFQMGRVPSDTTSERLYEDEKPRHAVTLSRAYYLDVAEVTVGQWKRYAAGGGGPTLTSRSGTTDATPVHNVTWDELAAFAKWAGADLPTEAQWERAAKGGHDDFVYLRLSAKIPSFGSLLWAGARLREDHRRQVRRGELARRRLSVTETCAEAGPARGAAPRSNARRLGATSRNEVTKLRFFRRRGPTTS